MLSRKHPTTVRTLIRTFTVQYRGFIHTMLQRQAEFFPLYEEHLTKYGLPHELKYLSIVESALNPRAVSYARAAGLWQFMSATGRQYHLQQDVYIDERLDPYKATDAACRYLSDLHETFGSWELALAAYNCGPGNVRRAIRRSGNRTSFWQIASFLPKQTRAYVPKFIAVSHVMSHAEQYGFVADSTITTVAVDTILLRQPLDLRTLAQQLGVPLDALRTLNPHLKKNVLPGYANEYALRIPIDKKEYFLCNRDSLLAQASPTKSIVQLASYRPNAQGPIRQKSKIIHVVKAGEVLHHVAVRYRVSTADLRRWNHLKTNLLQKGQRLVVWKMTKSEEFQRLANNDTSTRHRTL